MDYTRYRKTWNPEQLRMEHCITDNKINPKNNQRIPDTRKCPDYILDEPLNYPLAVVEAKAEKYGISYGMQQAKEYARILDAPFAYSSNGQAFQEYDFLTGVEREISLDAFPSPEELIRRREAEAHAGSGLDEEEKKIREQPYYTSQTTYPPLYYQQTAVNRILDAIACGQRRLLLVMATGTGKTYTAFQIVYRLLKSGMKKKVLFYLGISVRAETSGIISSSLFTILFCSSRGGRGINKFERLSLFKVFPLTAHLLSPHWEIVGSKQNK